MQEAKLPSAMDETYSFFGLSHPAFGPVLDPAQIFRSGLVEPVIKEVMAGGAVLSVQGGRGVGKTMFMHVLAMELEARAVTTIMVGGEAVSPDTVQTLIAQAAGLDGFDLAPDALLRAVWQHAGITRLVLLCDDAQDLPAETFHYLALLLKQHVTQPVRVQLILLGATGAWPGLGDPDLDTLRRATTTSFITLSLRNHEATAYLDHRLRYGGQTLAQIMTPSAAIALREQAHGNPRRLDELARQALVHGYRTGRRRLTARSVRQALEADGVPPARTPGGRIIFAAAAAVLLLAAAGGLAAWFAGGDGRGVGVTLTAIGGRALAQRGAASMPPPPLHPGAIPALVVTTQPVAPPVVTPRDALRHGPGLVLIAGPRDTLPALYAKVYRGLTPPPYATVVAANRLPVRPGALLVFPEPPHGWASR